VCSSELLNRTGVAAPAATAGAAASDHCEKPTCLYLCMCACVQALRLEQRAGRLSRLRATPQKLLPTANAHPHIIWSPFCVGSRLPLSLLPPRAAVCFFSLRCRSLPLEFPSFPLLDPKCKVGSSTGGYPHRAMYPQPAGRERHTACSPGAVECAQHSAARRPRPYFSSALRHLSA